MANIPVSSAINTLLTSTTLNASTTALSALGAGYPTLFSSTAPVNGRVGYLNTSVLSADDGTIVTAPILFADTLSTNVWSSDDYVASQGEYGWLLEKTGSNWSLNYWEGFTPVGGWSGVGAGANPDSTTIVWTPVPTSLGIPLFTSVQTSGSTVGKLGQVLHSTIANNVFRYECISEYPYTWQLDSTVTVSSTTPTNPILGMEWFEETSTQSIFYTGASWIGTNYNSQAQKDGYTRALAAHMTEQIDSRLAGKDAATDMRLFTGLASNTTATTFTPNTTCWLHSLRSQLCGFHMGAGGYGQSYGLLPLGGRFFLCVAHNGPSAGATVYYPLPDGTTFTTTIQRIFLDNATTGVSLTSTSPDTVASGARRAYDFSIYITAAAAPSTLSVIPLVNLDINYGLMNALNPPTVYISQGSSSATGTKQPTPQNRKCAVMPFINSYYSADTFALRSSFGHSVSTGDSGCPQYLLINNKLYLQEMNTIGFGPISTGNGFNYIQDLVNRSAAAHSISPITITTITNPPLS